MTIRFTTPPRRRDQLQDAADEIKQTVAQARDVVDQINAGQGTVGKLVKDDTLYNETTASMTNLKEILAEDQSGQGSVGKLVNDQEFYKNAKLSLQKLDKATESLEDTGPLSLLGHAGHDVVVAGPAGRSGLDVPHLKGGAADDEEGEIITGQNAEGFAHSPPRNCGRGRNCSTHRDDGP